MLEESALIVSIAGSCFSSPFSRSTPQRHIRLAITPTLDEDDLALCSTPRNHNMEAHSLRNVTCSK